MNNVRNPNSTLDGLVPYDPMYLPAQAMLSANECPFDLPSDMRSAAEEAVHTAVLNRYGDPLSTELRSLIAEEEGLVAENVLVGNGGDEILFDIALAWGGHGRTMLNLPPTFSTYAASARVTGTAIIDIARMADYSIDEAAVLDRVSQGDVDYVVVCNPNNPSGNVTDLAFIEKLLDASDALVLVDEAYYEFSGTTCVPLLDRHENLAIMRTLSKAYRLAGVRVGYLLAAKRVVSELCKVRLPYSVNVLSQAVATQVYARRAELAEGTEILKAESMRVQQCLQEIPGLVVYPSTANFVLVHIGDTAASVWQGLYERGVLVRDFSINPYTAGCLRFSIGTPEQNDLLLSALSEILEA